MSDLKIPSLLQFSQLRPAYSRLEDYFGFWAMNEPQFAGLFALISDMNLRDHVSGRTLSSSNGVEINASKIEEIQAAAGRNSSKNDDAPYEIVGNGIALIPVRGTLMKAQSSFSSSSSTVAVRKQLRQAKDDPQVRGVVTVIDSPGGTVSGTADLAAELAALQKVKPTAAFAEDLCASAAYWYASQAGLICCNSTALVGSIGTFMTVEDYSGRAEEMKIKVHVIRAGEFKGAGTPGTAITDEQLANWQRMVNSLNSQFISGVAAGRNLSLDAVKTIADGRVHVGSEAKQLGLVDCVQSLDETIRQVEDQAGQRGVRMKGTTMTEQNPTLAAAAASLDELTAHLIGADDSFVMKQLRGKVTLDQAKSNWMQEQQARQQAKEKELAAKEKELADLRATATNKPVGVEPLGAGKPSASDDDDCTGSAVDQFSDAVGKLQQAGMTRTAAVAAVARKNPKLHQSFLAATNPGAKSKRLMSEKYGD